MTKEELLEKYGVVLENFTPVPGAAIKITIDQDIIDVETAGKFAEAILSIYPDRKIFTTFKGMEIN